MSRSDNKLLVMGVLLGLAIAAGIHGAREYLPRNEKPDPVSADQPGGRADPAAAPREAISDSPTSIALSAEEQRSLGVETTEVERQTIRKEILTPGEVEEPETGMATISARSSGRIEKLFLNVTGVDVVRGQPVASIYSPELLASTEEHKLALENRLRLSASKEPRAIEQADELVQSSRRRLELRGLTPEQIAAITPTSTPAVQLTMYSPIAGVVTKRNVSEGQYVKEGDALYTVSDLSTVWIQADVFEFDIPAVRRGMQAKITSSALGKASLRGTITFLQPAVDPQTRTMSARIEVPNPEMRLRPGMFVQVVFDTPIASDALAVPRSAVLNTGKEQLVYVAKENGLFEKRVIAATATGDEFYSVIGGLSAGERVVTKGNFLIDSQTRLSGSITGMFGGSKAFDAGGQSPEGSLPNYTVTLQTEPSPPKGGADRMFHVSVNGPDGKPVTDAQVQVSLLMPAMPSMGMGEMRSSITLTWNGSEYSGSGPIAMAGPWNVTVEARRHGQLLGVYRSRFDAK